MPELTPREKTVAERLLRAESNREIGKALGVSSRMIKDFLVRMCRKLNIPMDRHPRVLLALKLHAMKAELGLTCPHCREKAA